MARIFKVLIGGLFASCILVHPFGPNAQATNTANYYRCLSRVSGEWNFGRAPDACRTSEFGDDRTIEADFGQVIFQDSASDRTIERKRYMNQMHALIRDAAAYYIYKRKPSASQAEVANWTWAVLTTAANESYWSHYRKPTDLVLRMMRGDYGHGHGLMQVDDRAHFNAVETGLASNYSGNLIYGFDELFANWERAPKQSCVSSSTDWVARIRSAWAAYNGGPRAICRWTDSSSSWARNDENFYYHLKNKTWASWVTEPTKVTSFDVPCIVEQGENCPTVQKNTSRTVIANQLYELPNKAAYCASSDLKSWHCVADVRDRVCLTGLVPKLSSTQAAWITSAGSNGPSSRVLHDRHELCASVADGLIKVGTGLLAEKAINLRSTPGGGLLGTIESQKSYSVVDFEVRTPDSLDRYYKVKDTNTNTEGWIYAGDNSSWAEWAVASTEGLMPGTVARVSELVQIQTKSGINIRETPAGVKMGTLAKGGRYTVKEVRVQGSNNSIFYRVNSKFGEGFIYSGELLPKETVSAWTLRQLK